MLFSLLHTAVATQTFTYLPEQSDAYSVSSERSASNIWSANQICQKSEKRIAHYSEFKNIHLSTTTGNKSSNHPLPLTQLQKTFQRLVTLKVIRSWKSEMWYAAVADS